jgi:hypothetical protein
MVPAVRRLARALLEGTPRAHDAEVVVSELVTIAVLRPRGGEFTLTVRICPGWARIEVAEDSAPGRPEPATDCTDLHSEHLYTVVDALADRWGHFGIVGASRTAWAETNWPGIAG